MDGAAQAQKWNQAGAQLHTRLHTRRTDLCPHCSESVEDGDLFSVLGLLEPCRLLDGAEHETVPPT